jgi:hypothetical protein
MPFLGGNNVAVGQGCQRTRISPHGFNQRRSNEDAAKRPENRIDEGKRSHIQVRLKAGDLRPESIPRNGTSRPAERRIPPFMSDPAL